VKLALALIPAAALVACTAEVGAPPDPTTSDGSEGLTLTTAKPDRITGSYLDTSGHQISFDVARTPDALFMEVRTGSGHELIHAETVGDSYVFHYMDNRLTLTVDKAWIAEVEAEGDDGPAMSDTSGVHWDGDRAVLDEMLTLPEVQSLPWLSRALGTRGITGNAFPASLPLHKIARQSADALNIQVPPLAIATTESYCSQPTANDCYGMCGPGCSCWSWVCGDCCYHSGCAKHDSWCRSGAWYWCYNITAVVALFGC
jgi:hypothetical protein